MHLKFRYRTAIFLGIVLLSILGRSLPMLADWPAVVSPFIAFSAMLGAIRTPIEFLFPEMAVVIAVVLVLVVPCVRRRRFLCRTACPLGYCIDIVGKARRKTTGKNTLPPRLRSLPKLGAFLAVFTWFSCLFGMVGFLWLDPFVLFGAVFRWATPLTFLFASVLVLSFFAPSLWCQNVCPLGGTQEILFFPRTVLARHERNSPGDPLPETPLPAGRRGFLGAVLLMVATGSGFVLLQRKKSAANDVERLRPPGAVPDPLFSSLCSRCGACIRACPTQLLKPLPFESGLLSTGIPRLEFEPAWCRDDCVACTETCPTGALRRLPLSEKTNAKIGTAVLCFENCLLYEDVECAICGRECPYEAISYQWSEEEYRQIPIIDASRCTGCGRCVVTCPVKIDVPLQIIPALPGESEPS